jgi:uncharacterized integral membrane protein
VTYERLDPDQAPAQPRSGVSPTVIALGIVAIVAVIFIVQNSSRTDVNFLFFNVRSRVWVALLVAIGIGVLLDRLFIAWWRRRRTRADG